MIAISPETAALTRLKHQLLHWASTHEYCAVFDNCGSDIDQYGEYELLIGVAETASSTNTVLSWEKACSSDFSGKWLMGIFPYALKNAFHTGVFSRHADSVPVPEVAVFAPDTVIAIRRGSYSPEVLHGNKAILEHISPETLPSPTLPAVIFQANFTETEYIDTIRRLQQHITDGDFYEINLAQEFTAHANLHPATAFSRLIAVSPVPFAAFARLRDTYLMCASPERFLQWRGGILTSQPIKGTSKRGISPEEDAQSRHYLQHSLKERAENVMIADLTRNDLQRSCNTGSVRVPHLFEVQTFPTVHQLVTTVQGDTREGITWQEIFRQTFPPGSMTGAPKVATLRAIDAYERSARGSYAGCAGYIQPNGDFDFNVIIRSLRYDALRQRLSYHVGGAITADSDPAAEYAETLLKAEAIKRVFAP